MLKVLELPSDNLGQMTVISQVKLTAIILSIPEEDTESNKSSFSINSLQHNLVDKYFCYHSKMD